ncbi:MAG: hypothetical protein AAFN65_09800, partial [Bacteroidota bacterium]
MKLFFQPLAALVALLFLCQCAAVDLRKGQIDELVNDQAEQRGRALMQSTYEAMGYNALSSTETYEVTANFKWNGFWLLMPMNSFPQNNKKDIQMRFVTNTFDGQVEYLEGPRKNRVYGVQSWQHYRQSNQESPMRTTNNAKYPWGLATYHYLIESPMRLLSAEIIKYAGEKIWSGQTYDLVFITWGSEEPNKEYDQWLVYINRETGFVDLAQVTLSDFWMPTPNSMEHATI